MPKKQKNLKIDNLAHQDHCDFLDKMEEMSMKSFDFVMRRVVAELIAHYRLQKLKKSSDLKGGWTGKVPKIQIDVGSAFTKVLNKHMNALRWMLLGDSAGKEAIAAAKELKMSQLSIPGVVPASYLNSLDTNRKHYEDLFGKDAPELKPRLIQESLEEIKKRTEKYLEENILKMRNRMETSVNEVVTQLNNENTLAVHEKSHDLMSDGLSPTKAVKEAIDKVVSDNIEIPRISRALSEAIEKHRDDWKNLTNIDTGLASAVGSHQSIAEVFGSTEDDIRIAWIDFRDEKVCSFCRDASRRPDGSYKIYRLTDFEPAGYNYSRKKADWKLCVPPSHYNCFDDQTDVLTRRGWIRFADLDQNDEFLSVDLQTGKPDWVFSNHLIMSQWNGDMVSFTNRSYNLITTPDHNHVVKYRVKQKGRKDAGVWKLVNGSDLGKYDFNFLATIPCWEGEDFDFIEIGSMRFPADVFFEFMGYFLSEGSISQPKGRQWQIKISQKKYKTIMDDCCKRLWSKIWIGKEATYAPLYDSNVIDFFRKFGKSWDKFIPDMIKRSSKRQIRIFLDALLLGDGSRRKNKQWKGCNFSDSLVYHTSSKRMADDISELILKIGKRPKMTPPKEGKVCHFRNGDYLIKHPCWSVIENRNTSPNIDSMEIKEINYTGYVYDVELEKHHTLFVRRNGQIVLSGNCRCQLVVIPGGFDIDERGHIKPSQL
jgi:hypothetical protein